MQHLYRQPSWHPSPRRVWVPSKAAVTGTLTSSVLKNNTGTVLASETGATVFVNLASTNALVLTLTSQTTNGSGVWTVSDAALTPSTSYRVVYKLASGAEGMETLTAS